MTDLANNPVFKAAQLAWKPADMRPPWQWAEDNYYVPVSSVPGKWRSENAPWVRRPMEVFADNAVRQITILCSAQSAKTETMLALLNWIVAEDPSPTMWVTSSGEESVKFCNERLMPSLHLCPPVAKQIPNDRTLAKQAEILFPTMMLEVVGAESKAKLQSRSRRFLLLDEVRNWPSWALPMVLKRSRTWWNSRTVILSTPDQWHDTVHTEFLNGSQEHYHIPCLAGCGYSGPLSMDNLKSEHPVTKKCVRWGDVPGARTEDGKWDFDLLAPTLRYVCPQCGHMHADTPPVRRQMAMSGSWVAHNPKPSKEHLSFTWNALVPTWVKWKSVVKEFILAESALSFGNHEPLKAFINETLGQPWEDRLRFVKTEGYIDARVSSFDPRAKWPEEARRFMTVDVQGKGGRHFYWQIVAFTKGGAHRIISAGKAWSIEELRSTAIDWQVDAPNIAIDSGNWSAEVYGYIMESGVLPDGGWAWKALKGDRAPHYLIDGVRRPFTWSFIDPYLGTGQANRVRPIRQILFSKPTMLDRAEAIMRGTGLKLEICDQVDMLHEMKAQMTAYERFERKAPASGEVKIEWVQKRADDHWGSCYRMALVCAYATGLIDARA